MWIAVNILKQMSLYVIICYCYCSSGHARCHVDAGFASIKKLYRRTDCETIGQLEEVINRSCMANLAVRYPQWQWRNWKVFLGATFKPLKNIRYALLFLQLTNIVLHANDCIKDLHAKILDLSF